MFPGAGSAVDCFVIDTTGGATATTVVHELRSAGIRAERAYDGRSMKSQMKSADGSGARLAVIIGDDELAASTVTVRDLADQRAVVGPRGPAPRSHQEGLHPVSQPMRTHHCGDLRPEHIGQVVSVCGWVAKRREHGEHLAFVDLRDHTGIVQCVVDGAADLRSEFVVRITGTVRQRPEGTSNERAGHR